MLDGIRQMLSKRIYWMRYQHALNRMTRMDEFRAFIEKIGSPAFRMYEEMHGEKMNELRTVARELHLHLKGAAVLDIGPGYGSTLEACRELGAAILDFVERDPTLYTFNRLKGYGRGYRLDVRKGMAEVPSRRYDLVWFKGTLTADHFEERGLMTSSRILHRYPALDRFLENVERLAAPDGTIVFCPHWNEVDGRRTITDVLDTSVAGILLNRGYGIPPFIAGHNNESHYPVTFLKTMPPASSRERIAGVG